MPDYKFKLTKTTDLVISAGDEEGAWIEITKVDPDLLGLQWSIELVPFHQETKIDTGPVELDDYDSEQDLSFLDPDNLG